MLMAIEAACVRDRSGREYLTPGLLDNHTAFEWPANDLISAGTIDV